ncbi:MAG: OmpL47-type beta-barrel domain-containing protein [Vicinamibacterales bacterium]
MTLVADMQPPVTTASMAPEPNASGWLSVKQVVVSLSAVDDLSGVREILYRASGATTLPVTAAAGAAAQVPVTAEGETTVTVWAIDNAGKCRRRAVNRRSHRPDAADPHVRCHAERPLAAEPPDGSRDHGR